jgi:hypothetical protein
MLKLNMTNYSDDFIKKIIDSLVIGNVLIFDTEKYHINHNMEDYIDMIKIFHSINNTNEIIKKEINEELCHDRCDIISTNINHFVKINEMKYNDLYNIVNKNITLFEVKQDLFDKVIENMIKKEYIVMNDNVIRKV